MKSAWKKMACVAALSSILSVGSFIAVTQASQSQLDLATDFVIKAEALIDAAKDSSSDPAYLAQLDSARKSLDETLRAIHLAGRILSDTQ